MGGREVEVPLPIEEVEEIGERVGDAFGEDGCVRVMVGMGLAPG